MTVPGEDEVLTGSAAEASRLAAEFQDAATQFGWEIGRGLASAGSAYEVVVHTRRALLKFIAAKNAHESRLSTPPSTPGSS
jgi:hypothetical protein